MTDAETVNDLAQSSYDAGRDHRETGQLDLALESFSKALSLAPAFAKAALGLGQTYYDLGRSSEALHYLEQALEADPDNADALCYCGLALADAGHFNLALEFSQKAIEAEPDNLQYAQAAIGVLQGVEFTAEHPWYENFLVECLENPLLSHVAVPNVAASLLWVKPAMQDVLSAERPDASQLARLAQEPLLTSLLSNSIVPNWAFEQFFTRLRRALAEVRDADFLVLTASVAEQAFNTGYIQFQTEDELALEQELLEQRVESLAPVDLMVLASYRELIDVPGADEIADRSDYPEPTQRVIRKTLQEPLRERAIRTEIETITPIDDAVSARVQAQYEEHPYPRWIEIQTANYRDERLVDEIANHSVNFENAGWPETPRVLVPGCGTGYHPLSLARRHPETDILAVDLSLTSLAYAIRKQQDLGLTNVRFRQGDLLRLGEMTERFDYIDCSGVLHHLQSPMAGWRVLSRLLKPGGVMRIGLYSELARSTIVAAREVIAARGISGTLPDIRAFRQAIMSDPDLSELRGLATTTADFYSLGGIRDLIFHVQETRFDPAAIKQCLEDLGLEFGGMLLPNRDVVLKFHALHPSRAEWLDLDCWAGFEAQNPGTFYGMYQFYCLKPQPDEAGSTSDG